MASNGTLPAPLGQSLNEPVGGRGGEGGGDSIDSMVTGSVDSVKESAVQNLQDWISEMI